MKRCTRLLPISAYNHAEYVEQRRRMMQDWADRLDLCGQGAVEAAMRQLTIYLDDVAVCPARPWSRRSRPPA